MSSKRVCLFVTGASRGIGRSVAKVFSQDGALLDKYAEGSKIILMARTQPGLEETKALISNPNIEVSLLLVDLSSAADVERTTSKALELAGDPTLYDWAVMVHNAGSLGDVTKSAINHTDFPTLSRYFDLNLNSVIFQTGRFCDHFKGVERLVLNISSLAALQPLDFMSLYCTGKAARQIYFRCLASECPDISVMNYAPGPVESDMTVCLRDSSGSEETRSFMKNLFDTKTILQADTTISKLAEIIKKREFKSGDHVDYFNRVC